MNVPLVSRSKKFPQQDTSMFPPLTSLPSSKSADQLETIKTSCCRGNRTRRLSGFTDIKNLNFSHNQSKSSKYSNNLTKNFKNVSTISPVSTPSNGKRFGRRNVRRASMPIVLVNGKKEFHKQQLKLLPEDGTSDKG